VKEELLDEARRAPDIVARTNIARQYLQRQILACLAGNGAFQSLAFVGGTCLRFLYDLKRYSEDMDFSVESATGYDPDRWIEAVRLALTHQGFALEATWRKRRAVDFGWIKVSGILHDLGAARMKTQFLSIKIEVDRKPPAGARCETTALTVPRLIAVRHHDLPSLMAGKLNAVLSRPYAKGRDWYDLLWYLARKVEPNLVHLEYGLAQNPSVFCHDAQSWRQGALDRLQSLDWPAMVRDIRPFLEDPSELGAFTADTVGAMLGKRPVATSR
jgi:predicted nucleotidyltransferase component of viral defense system